MAQAKRFRVALSFPSEKLAFVEAVAQRLASVLGKEKVLYYKVYEAEFNRLNLDIYLQRLYHEESELIAVFICEEYGSKDWCAVEWRAILDLIKSRRGDILMFFRFDNTEIPGLFSNDGCSWIGKRSPDEIANLILERLSLVSSEATSKAALALGTNDLQEAFDRISAPLVDRIVDPAHWIARREDEQLVKKVTETRVTCLIGSPGCGKTALLAKLAKDAKSNGFVVAIKADLIPHDERFADWAEAQLHLAVPLVEAIKTAALHQKVTIIVDQLDALASLVDLKSDRLNDVIDFIAICASIPGVSIVCSCREFEYYHDTRISSLQAESLSLGLPDWEHVVPELRKVGVEDSDSWPHQFRDILRNPQHLQIYLRRLKETGKHDPFGSYQAMLDDLWKRKLTTESQRDFVYRLAKFLVEKETLWAPAVQFESDDAIIEKLEAEEFIQRQGHQLGFRHQTLLEHAKARLFAKSGRSLCDFVLERQTAILVRPTLWAVLRYLREADPDKYREELDRLMASDLRLHVRYLLIDFLSQVNQPEDFEVLHMTDRLKAGVDSIRVLIAIRGKQQWFQAISDTVLPMVMCWKPQDQWPMIGVISEAWKFASEECLRLIERYWLPDPEKDALIWRSLQDVTSWDQRSVDLICKVIRRSGQDDDRLWWAEDVVYRVSEGKPDLAPKVFLAVVEREVSHEKSPSRRSPLDSTNAWYKLPEVSRAAPIEFLRTAWDWFVKTAVEFHNSQPSSVLNEYGGYLSALDRGDDTLPCPITAALTSAVTATALTDPAAFMQITWTSRSVDNLAVQKLLARGYSIIAQQHPERAFEFLTEDPRRFALRDYPDDCVDDTTNVISAIALNWDENGRHKLEKVILAWSAYRPNSDMYEERCEWDREARLRLLMAIPKDLMSPEISNLVEQEKRDLPHWNRKRRHGRSGFVREIPPMTRTEMEESADEKVLEALRGPQHHPRSAAEWKEAEGGWEEPGGAWAASQELAELAKTNRDRVFSLLPKILEDGNEAPVAHVLHTLVETELPPNEAFGLIRKLAAFGPKSDEFRSSAGYLLYKRCHEGVGLPDDLCLALESWLEMPWESESPIIQPNSSQALENESDKNLASVLWGYRGDSLHTDKSFFPLLAATEGYLMKTPPATAKWLDLVERLLDQGIAEETWRNYCFPLRWIQLKDSDHNKGVSVVLKLFRQFPAIKFSVEGCRLFATINDLIPESAVRSFLEDLLNSKQFRDQQAFGEILTVIALRGKPHGWAMPVLEEHLNKITSGSESEAVATGIAFATAHLWDLPEARPHACEILCKLAPHATPRIATAFGTVFWTQEGFPADEHTDALLSAIAANPAILSGSFVPELIELLVDLLPHSRHNILAVCQAIVKSRGNELTSLAHELFLSGPHLVNIAMTLQRFDDTRSEGLTLLEDLLRLGLDEAFSILHDIDIRPAPVRRREPHRRRRRRKPPPK
jgi:hypothetical protein